MKKKVLSKYLNIESAVNTVDLLVVRLKFKRFKGNEKTNSEKYCL